MTGRCDACRTKQTVQREKYGAHELVLCVDFRTCNRRSKENPDG